MLHDLTSEQRQLADFMSNISEKCYYAGWLSNLEYILWDAVNNGEKEFGHGIISDQDVRTLMQLSKDCNCWIYYDDTTEETALDLANWRYKFNEAAIKNPSIIKA
jgi:hypothetical protein